MSVNETGVDVSDADPALWDFFLHPGEVPLVVDPLFTIRIFIYGIAACELFSSAKVLFNARDRHRFPIYRLLVLGVVSNTIYMGSAMITVLVHGSGTHLVVGANAVAAQVLMSVSGLVTMLSYLTCAFIRMRSIWWKHWNQNIFRFLCALVAVTMVYLTFACGVGVHMWISLGQPHLTWRQRLRLVDFYKLTAAGGVILLPTSAILMNLVFAKAIFYGTGVPLRQGITVMAQAGELHRLVVGLFLGPMTVLSLAYPRISLAVAGYLLAYNNGTLAYLNYVSLRATMASFRGGNTQDAHNSAATSPAKGAGEAALGQSTYIIKKSAEYPEPEV